MRMLVGAVAVVAALATGGVPAVVFTAGQGDGGVAVDGGGPEKPADKDADGKPGYGPPAHAMSSHNVVKPRGRAHGKAMRAWGACVSEQPGHDAEGFDPEAACGERPTPPGHVKKPTPPGHAKHRSAGR